MILRIDIFSFRNTYKEDNFCISIKKGKNFLFKMCTNKDLNINHIVITWNDCCYSAERINQAAKNNELMRFAFAFLQDVWGLTQN